MAEATDRPHGSEPAPSNAASAEDRVSTQPQSLAAPRGEFTAVAPPSTETYRPLSLLALAGFGVAAIYALVVLIGAAVALFNHIPWLMPSWTFLLPLAAVVLCWAARACISNSEGTLSGQAFTIWGLRLAILVGLTYTAYYGATFFAVRGQAVDCADSFFEHLKQGDLEQAFLLSLGIPAKDVDSADLRNTLESRFNSPSTSPGSIGELTRFRRAPYVRYLQMGGGQANIVLKGVSEWEYSKGGYRVVLRYHIATATMDCEMNLETFGRDSKPGEPKGRQWQVILPRGDAAIPTETRKITPYGQDLIKKSGMAERFAAGWAEKINLQQWSEAYLDTLAPGERSGLSKSELKKGQENLTSGKLLRIDEKRFWAGKQQRADITQRVQNTFRPGRASFMLSLAPQVMPVVRESDGRTTALLDVELRYGEENSAKTKYVVLGQLVVTAKEEEAADSPSAWRVEAIDIESGRTPPDASRPSKR